jgi:hypothetical protein
MKNFTFTNPENPIKEEIMGRACSRYGEECVQGFGGEN